MSLAVKITLIVVALMSVGMIIFSCATKEPIGLTAGWMGVITVWLWHSILGDDV